jgi:hypothetical protein
MSESKRTLWRAGGLSMALHVAALVVFLQLPAPSGAPPGPLIVETIKLADDEPLTMTLTLAEERPAPALPAPTPPAAEPSASDIKPPVQPSVSKPAANGGHAAPATPGSLAGRTPSGNRVGTSFFQVGTQARSVVYVLDRSVSMGLNGTLDIVKRELLSSLSKLPADARFQVVFYNRQVEPLRIGADSGLHPVNADMVARLNRELSELRAEGGTEHLPALRAALALQPDAIYFLTDAGDLGPDTVRAVTQLNRGNTPIHVIELVRSRQWQAAASPLYKLAQTNRGAYQALAVTD